MRTFFQHVHRYFPNYLYRWNRNSVLLLLLCCLAGGLPLKAQMDQGTITGTVKDAQGGVVPHATVTITEENTGFSLTHETDNSGVYVFSPLKIGRYSVLAKSPGFSNAEKKDLDLQVGQRLGVDLELQVGLATQTVKVLSNGPILQTEEASTSQEIGAQAINDTPLITRNYVFIAQLTPGVTPPEIGARGQANGDFSANGQRSEQNNFLLDGIDNNSNLVDNLNGASYIIGPPPDALQEFKIQTGTYSAEFGHSSGAVINASIRSGSNSFHGDAWEYLRNDALDARDYFTSGKVPEYRQNQFGATFGGPILRNKLFFFVDYQGTRIVQGTTDTTTVPTPLMRTGDFTELLNPSLTQGATRTLYVPGSGGATLQQCNGIQNVLCPNQINSIADSILKLYPQPNVNNGNTYNNYLSVVKQTTNTDQGDVRVDYNPSEVDQAFARFSISQDVQASPSIFGILDGGGYGNAGTFNNLGKNFALSETHEFTNTFTNEFRVGYNWAHASQLQVDANTDVSSQLGFGGIPFKPLNGGLPGTTVSGISGFGSPGYYPSDEHENVYQILDNVTKIFGNHTFRAGINMLHVRFAFEQPPSGHGSYTYSGLYTSLPSSQGDTGSGIADFLTDNQASASLSQFATSDDVRWDRAAYGQDDWKLTDRLTLNLGLRYEYVQPYEERHDQQANFVPADGTSTAQFLLPQSQSSTPLPAKQLAALALDNIQVGYTSNRTLVDPDYMDWAPRIGVSWRTTDRMVWRAGYGIFYGGLENTGSSGNLTYNAPFQFTSNFSNSSCTVTSCPTDGITLANGFSDVLSVGLGNYISLPKLVSAPIHSHTPYSQQWNLSTEYALSNNLEFNLAYVGSNGRHLQVLIDPNQPFTLLPPGANVQSNLPYPAFASNSRTLAPIAISSYNSLQARLERRFSGGLSFLGAYTWSHSLDDSALALGNTGLIADRGAEGYRNPQQLGIRYDYGNGFQDVRQRFALSGQYDLPFGNGRRYLNDMKRLNYMIGGWSSSLVFTVQTGQYIELDPSNNPTNGVGNSFAVRVGNPFSAGGTAAPGTPNTCAMKVKTVTSWFNPCAFANPPVAVETVTGANQVALSDNGGLAAYGTRGRTMVSGPGYNRADISLFKSFPTFEQQYLQFRADIFNIYNTPAFGLPNGNVGAGFGSITSERFSPDARVVQLALKYYF